MTWFFLVNQKHLPQTSEMTFYEPALFLKSKTFSATTV